VRKPSYSKSPLNRNPRAYQGPLPPGLEPLRPFLVEHDAIINSILAAQAAIKAAIEALELQHAELNDRLCEYAEAKLKMR
jgi:hypothetical protein